ncbi:hypothetical protein BaRGS_00026828 [Batillaria attramentaria]|uniref:Uncharacterized protein n=1 Tax=Batillaria attramentaria TaxID=370345 RepID=A0ABD0K4S2_9CAEN
MTAFFTECITGRWSANCSLPCGQCAGDGSCNVNTGRCIGGCLEGFLGDVCTQKRQGDVNVAGPIAGSLLRTGALIGLSVFSALVVC